MASKRLILHTGINYATWSSVNKSAHVNLTGGNLIATTTSTAGKTLSTIPVYVGNKNYCEILCTVTPTTSQSAVGIESNTGALYNEKLGTEPTAWGLVPTSNATGQVYHNGAYVLNGYSLQTFGAGDIIGIAVDNSTGTIQWYKNGSACGTSVAITTGVAYYIAVSPAAPNVSFTANFGASPFTYSVPAGFTGGIY